MHEHITFHKMIAKILAVMPTHSPKLLPQKEGGEMNYRKSLVIKKVYMYTKLHTTVSEAVDKLLLKI